ncbi:MAG TPA: hypothetical protein VFG33_19460, partial [Kribbella sp.]|uniref:hypothetical protein n=1 Tax=Kribbella sp. TaxID=1871183 RepID=UPI002D783781
PEKVIQTTGARVVSVARELIESTSRHVKAEREPAGQAVRQSQSPSSLGLLESAIVEGPGL